MRFILKSIFFLMISCQLSSLVAQDTILSDYIVSNPDLDKVKQLIQKGIDVNRRNQFNISPLEIACKSGNLDLSKLLISHGARLNDKLTNDRTALMIALSEGSNYELIEYLLQSGAEINIKDKFGVPAFFYLYMVDQPIFGTRLNLIKLLEKYGADITQTNKDNTSLLFKTVASCDLPATQYLILDKKFDINSTNMQQKNIFDKMAHCNTDMIKFLFSLNPKILNYEKLFFHAANVNNVKIVSYLVDSIKKVDINIKDRFHRSALMLAYTHTNDETINYLLQKGIDINAKDTFGITILMQVSYICNLNLIKKLVENKIKINIPDNDNWTALDYSEKSYMGNKEEVIAYLKSIGAKNGKDKKEKSIFK